MGQNINLLWKYYKENDDPGSRNKLISYYAPFVKTIVHKIYCTLPNAVESSELESYANLGLMDAMEKFDYKRGIKFETYASIRVRGAIMDGIRKQDWLPRSLRNEEKKLQKEQEQASGNGSLKKNHANYVLMSLDDPQFSQNNNFNKQEYQNIEEESLLINTPDFADKVENKICIKTAVKALNRQERKVIYLYYFKGRTFKEIGAMMSVTESRVSQIHKKSLKKLKNSMGEFFK